MNTDEHGSAPQLVAGKITIASRLFKDLKPIWHGIRDGWLLCYNRGATPCTHPRVLELSDGSYVCRSGPVAAFLDAIRCRVEPDGVVKAARHCHVVLENAVDLLNADGLVYCQQCNRWVDWTELVDQLGWPDEDDLCRVCLSRNRDQ